MATILKVGNINMQTNKELRHSMVGPAKLWKMKRDFQIHFLRSMKLAPEHYLLDIGCGTLRGGVPIIQYLQESHYYGIEVREDTLDEGRSELEEEALIYKKPKLVQFTDISQLTFDRKFDFIWAYSVLIHMSDDVLGNTFDFVQKHLSKDGAFYANVNIGERKDGEWQGFPIVWKTLDFYGRECTRYGLTHADLGPLRDHGHISNIMSQDSQRMLKITNG